MFGGLTNSWLPSMWFLIMQFEFLCLFIQISRVKDAAIVRLVFGPSWLHIWPKRNVLQQRRGRQHAAEAHHHYALSDDPDKGDWSFFSSTLYTDQVWNERQFSLTLFTKLSQHKLTRTSMDVATLRHCHSVHNIAMHCKLKNGKFFTFEKV